MLMGKIPVNSFHKTLKKCKAADKHWSNVPSTKGDLKSHLG